ncbi:DUF2521 family protein [Bacillus sp. FJAT-45350]|uniref:DUF2521 family protein n=1 Tax=Bacillus sp. FJAT-45350 TaxID=2011014 RepID=UPI000BB7BEEE|nr:DUF2521 family protein [Bacillus sp. FJAT-45350]
MAVITTFSEKQREKRWSFERKVLREISLTEVRKNVQEHFETLFPFQFLTHPFLIDPCIDMAIDAYLVGAEYSRHGYFGETKEMVRERCDEEVREIRLQLFDLLNGWMSPNELSMDSLYIAVDMFVEEWWDKGFYKGKERYRLRLH